MTRLPAQAPADGLMAFWAGIEPSYLLRYQEWHNCEHVPERVGIPGFLRGRRYRDVSGEPRFLMFYETEDSAVLGSEAYMAALNSPTPWTREALRYFRDPARNIYTLLAACGDATANPAPYVATMRFNLDERREEELLSVYRDQWLAVLAGTSDILRARLYRVDEAITGIVTSERKIYGDGPGAQRYLAMVESARPFDFAAGAITAFDGDDDGRRDVFANSMWLEFGYAKGD